MQVKGFNRPGRLVGPVEVGKVIKSDAEWSALRTSEQFQIARGEGAER